MISLIEETCVIRIFFERGLLYAAKVFVPDFSRMGNALATKRK